MRPPEGTRADAVIALFSRDKKALAGVTLVLDGPHGMVFDSFELVPADPRSELRPADVERRLANTLAGSLDGVKPARRSQPRHLRHFRIVPQVGFDTLDIGNGRTMLSLVCTDRPGLLADVAQVLRTQSLRVHDARIATFGERAEDVFQITATNPDGSDLPLDDTQQQALRAALLPCLQGDCR